MKRVLVAGCVLVGVAAALAGCGGSSKPSAAELQMQREANLYQIEQIERTWHQATSSQDLNMMMTLFAPGAVFNIGTETLTGKTQIRHFFATKAKPFQKADHWEADTASYKMKITVNSDDDKGTIYFECHYIDPKTSKVMAIVGVDHDVQKINGKWLIVDSADASPVLAALPDSTRP